MTVNQGHLQFFYERHARLPFSITPNNRILSHVYPSNSLTILPQMIPTMAASQLSKLEQYEVPSFAKRIAEHAPKYRVPLCMKPTPIQEFNVGKSLGTSIAPEVTLFIKRDDLTGAAATGNKLRKLEFLLAHALATNHDTVITAGGVQSNHARVTTVACRQLQLEPHVFLRCNEEPDPQRLGSDGNVFIHKMLGARIHLVKRMPYLTGLRPRMMQLKQQLDAQNHKAYLIGIGGSDSIGLWGYIDAYAEMLSQGVTEKFSHIALAIGSGGTTAGLSIANYLNESPLKIVAFTVSDDADYFYDHIDEMLADFGLDKETNARSIVTVIQAKGAGYGVNSEEDMRVSVAVASQSGIILDPTYTLKAVRGIKRELDKPDCGVFGSNPKILFVHTGGLFGLFDRRIEPFLDHSLATIWGNTN